MKTARRAMMAGNWKMNKDINAAKDLVEKLKSVLSGIDYCDMVVCPPFTALSMVHQTLGNSSIALGAQNMCEEKEGAFTGEISPVMLTDLGCRYVILGHSERRQFFGETNASVNRKIQAALSHKLVPIVCVGETLQEREEGVTFKVVEAQIVQSLQEVKPGDPGRLVIAYEPVWAIGTGKTATPVQAQEVHGFIRELLKKQMGPDLAEGIRVLYGGSIKPGNVDSLMGQQDIDGGLVGGASLSAGDFERIVRFQPVAV